MGRGRSKAGGGGGAGGTITVTSASSNAQNQSQVDQTQAQTGSTPSGITYDQFMQMSDAQKFQTIDNIINDPNIQVPPHVDGSTTSKVIYALGLNNKPTVVSDSQLDSMQGTEIFRTVYDANSTFTSPKILDQIRNGEYTQMSGSGGSVHGRAIYCATNFHDSAVYGRYEPNPMVMRMKIDPKAVIRSERSLRNQMNSDSLWQNYRASNSYTDDISLYAIAHGIDGWYSRTYTMMVNRGVLTASSQNRHINRTGGNITAGSSWKSAKIAP